MRGRGRRGVTSPAREGAGEALERGGAPMEEGRGRKQGAGLQERSGLEAEDKARMGRGIQVI